MFKCDVIANDDVEVNKHFEVNLENQRCFFEF